MIFEYVNSNNQAISLEGDMARVKSGCLHQYSWNPILSERDFGGKIEKFKKKPLEFDITLRIRGNLEERKAFLDTFTGATEQDVLALKPGKLFFGPFYLECYITSSESGKSEEMSCRSEKNIHVYAPYPFWIKEETYYIPPVDIEDEVEYLDVPVNFKNDHFAAADFNLKAHGPLTAVFFRVNENIYDIPIACEESECIILDTKSETIKKVDASGIEVNVYHSQNFERDNFKKMPPGNVSLYYNRQYPVELTIHQERSEPKWSEKLTDKYIMLLTEEGHPILAESGHCIIFE